MKVASSELTEIKWSSADARVARGITMAMVWMCLNESSLQNGFHSNEMSRELKYNVG